MPTSQPAPCSKPLSKRPEDRLFELPDVPADYQEPEEPAPSWEQQMAHAQLLLSWRAAQGLEMDHPPRHPARFVAV